MKQKNERIIKKSQTMFNVKAIGIDLESLKTEELYFTSKSDSEEAIEKRFNEVFAGIKFVKTLETEKADTDWRSMPESLFRKYGQTPANGFEVKATIYKTVMTYGVLNEDGTIQKKRFVLPFKVSEEVATNPNAFEISHVNGERVAIVYSLADKSEQYGMTLDTWKRYSVPCEPPKKRGEK